MKKIYAPFIRVKGAKVQTCVLPQSGFQPLLCQSRTHFCTLYSNEGVINLYLNKKSQNLNLMV